MVAVPATTVFGVSNAYGMPVVAVLGDGQLARMMQTEAIELGVETRVLASDKDKSAAQVFGDVRLGDYTNLEDLRAIVDGADAVTFDHEHVPPAVLEALVADGVVLHPGPGALRFAQDKLTMRERLTAAGLPCPAWSAVTDESGLRRFGDEHGIELQAAREEGGDATRIIGFLVRREQESRIAEIGRAHV